MAWYLVKHRGNFTFTFITYESCEEQAKKRWWHILTKFF